MQDPGSNEDLAWRFGVSLSFFFLIYDCFCTLGTAPWRIHLMGAVRLQNCSNDK